MTRWFAAWSSLWLIATALAEWLPPLFGADGLKPSSSNNVWIVLYSFIPDPLEPIWPLLFFVVGVCMFAGLRKPPLIVVGCFASAIMFGLLGDAAAFGWINDAPGGSPSAAAAYFLLSGAMWITVFQIYRDQRLPRAAL